MFTPTSRYADLPIKEIAFPSGATVKYMARRLVPPGSNFALITEHTFTSHERLDQITARYLNDPELFWRLCDANDVLQPAELTSRPGTMIRITLPAGIPGAPPDA